MLATTLVAPAAVVRRSVPLREVCSTERSGSTVIDIGSPLSATALASSTCWKSAGLTVCAEAGGAAPAEMATVPAAARRAAEIAAVSRLLMAVHTLWSRSCVVHGSLWTVISSAGRGGLGEQTCPP